MQNVLKAQHESDLIQKFKIPHYNQELLEIMTYIDEYGSMENNIVQNPEGNRNVVAEDITIIQFNNDQILTDMIVDEYGSMEKLFTKLYTGL